MPVVSAVIFVPPSHRRSVNGGQPAGVQALRLALAATYPDSTDACNELLTEIDQGRGGLTRAGSPGDAGRRQARREEPRMGPERITVVGMSNRSLATAAMIVWSIAALVAGFVGLPLLLIRAFMLMPA